MGRGPPAYQLGNREEIIENNKGKTTNTALLQRGSLGLELLCLSYSWVEKHRVCGLQAVPTDLQLKSFIIALKSFV